MASGGSKTTTTNTIPQWMSDAGKATYDKASGFIASNPITPYGGQMSAPVDPNIAKAGQQAAASVGTGQSQVTAGTKLATQAGSATTPHASAGQDWTAAGMASKYMDPYVQQVQQNTLREMGRQSEINQNAVNDAAGAAKAFGGDRHGIVAAEQAKNDAAAASDYLARSNEAAYNSGQSQFNTDRGFNTDVSKFNSGLAAGDLDRMNQSAGILGQLGNTSAGIASADTQRLLSSGLASQDVAQSADDRAYNEYLRQQNAPLDQYSQLAGIISGVPYSSTATQKTPGSIMNTIMGGAGLAASAASAFSDVRLKDNVVATGEKWHGLPVFEFDYKRDAGLDLPEGRHRGVMAQDAFVEYPDAVSVGNNGYLQIDYGQIARSDIQ
jgi:hypothetical protein